MFARDIAQNTARSECEEMPGSLPLPMWHNFRECAAPSTTSPLSEQWQSSTQRRTVEVTVIFQRGSYILCLAIKSPSNAIYSQLAFWVVRLDEDASWVLVQAKRACAVQLVSRRIELLQLVLGE